MRLKNRSYVPGDQVNAFRLSFGTSKLKFIVILSLFSCQILQGQFYTQDFGSTTTITPIGVTLTGGCGAGDPDDHFAVTLDADNIENFSKGATDAFLSAQDTDSGSCGSSSVMADIQDIDISGRSDIYLCFEVAEGDDGTNQDWDGDSRVAFQFSLDDGSFIDAAVIEATGGNNTEPGFDCDGDGLADATKITNAFTQYCFFLGCGGNSELDLRITIDNLVAGDEDIAIDNITLYENTPPASDPCGFSAEATIDKDDSTPGDPDTDGDDLQFVNPNSNATFTIEVSNTGTDILTSMVILDALTSDCARTMAEITTLLMSVGNNDAFLDPCESFSYTCTAFSVDTSFLNEITFNATGVSSAQNISITDKSYVQVPCTIENVTINQNCPSIDNENYTLCIDFDYYEVGQDSMFEVWLDPDGTTTPGGSIAQLGPYSYSSIPVSGCFEIPVTDYPGDASNMEELVISVVDSNAATPGTGVAPGTQVDPFGDFDCPQVIGILVDACDDEGKNEFVLLKNGAQDLDPESIYFDTPANKDYEKFDSISPISSWNCPCCIYINDDNIIPSDALIILTQYDNNETYDFTELCNTVTGNGLYVLQDDDDGNGGHFANNNSRSSLLKITGTSTCNDTTSYTYVDPPNDDGYFVHFIGPDSIQTLSPDDSLGIPPMGNYSTISCAPDVIPTNTLECWASVSFSEMSCCPAEIAGIKDTICSGTEVRLDTLITGTMGRLYYGLAFGSYDDTITVTVSPTITTTYFVIDSLTAFCFDTTLLTITVNPSPSISAKDTTICAGDSVLLSTLVLGEANSVMYGIAFGNYPDTITKKVAPPPSVITYFVRDSIEATGCLDTTMFTITVNPSPSISAKDTTICAGDSVLLSTLVLGEANSVMYGIAFGNYPDTITKKVAPPPGVITYFIRDSIEATGCLDTTMLTISVNDAPSITAMDTSICEGDSVLLSTLLTGAGAMNSIKYGLTFGSYPDTITKKVGPTAGETYYIIDSSSVTGCFDTTMLSITVLTPPSVSAKDTSICEGDSVLLSTLLTGAGAMNSIKYGLTFGSYPDTITKKVAPTSGETYYIIDSSSVTGCFDTTMLTIAVLTPPSVSAKDTTICEGDSVLLSTLLTGAGATNSIKYGLTFGSYPDTITKKVGPTAGETYYIIDSSSVTGCFDTTMLSITVLTPPSVSAKDTSICEGDSVLLSTLLTGAGAMNSIKYGLTFGSYPDTITKKVGPTSGETYYIIDSSSVTGCFDTTMLSITVLTPPSVSAKDTSICEGDSVLLSTLLTGAGAMNSIKYGLTFGSYPDTITKKVGPTSGETYYIIDSSSVTGCFDTTMLSITVLTPPSVSAKDTSICEGDSVLLSTLLTGAGAMNSIKYGLTFGSYPDTITKKVAPTSGETYYIIDSSSVTGCFDTTMLSITVLTPPSVSAKDTSICEGDSVLLSTLLTGAGAMNSIKYGLIFGSYPDTITKKVGPTSGETYYIIDSSSVTGCFDTTMLSITVLTPPSVSAKDTSICEGDSVLLSTLLTGAGAMNSIKYGLTFGSYPDTITKKVGPTAGETYYIIDSSSVTGCFDTTMLSITVLTPPSVSAKDTSICEGDSVLLSTLLTGAGAMNSIKYGLTFGSYPDTITKKVGPTSGETYYIIDSSSVTGCFDTTMLTITVNPTPSITGMDEVICLGDSVLLSDLIVGTTMGNVQYGSMFGIYTDTISVWVHPITDTTFYLRDSIEATSCVDTAVVMIQVLPVFTGTEIYNGCVGDGYSVTVGTSTYNESDPTGIDTLMAANGCDSIVTTTLVFNDNPSDPIVIPIEFCFGDGTSTELKPTSTGSPGDPFNILWDFEGEINTAASDNANVTGTDATTGSDLGTISYPSGADGTTDALSATGWLGSEAGDYFEFCITASSADVQVTDLSFFDDASGNGPMSYSVFSSDDNFAASIGTGATHQSFQATPNVVSGLSINVSTGDMLCFRIFGIGALTDGGTWRVDQVTISGTEIVPPAGITYNFYSDATGTQIAGAQGVASYDPGVTAVGTYNYWIAATDGMCNSDTVMTTITIHPLPDVSITINNISACNPATSDATFTITTPEANTTYELLDLSGMSLSPSVTGTASLTILQADLPAVTTTYKVLATNTVTGCSDTLTVQPTLTINDAPEAGSTIATTACRTFANAMSGMMAMIDLDDQISGNDAGLWEQVGTLPEVVTIDGDNVVDFTGLSTGIYTFNYIVKGTSPCPPDTAILEITVMDCPDPCMGFEPPELTPIEFCFGDGTSTTIIPEGGGFGPMIGDPFNVVWDFEGEVDTAMSDNIEVTGLDASTGPDLGTISYPAGDGSTDALSANGWSNQAGDYFEFCVSSSTSDIQITDLSFANQRSGMGPVNYEIYGSDDGYASVLDNGTTDSPFGNISLTGLTIAVDATTSMCFRLFATDASNMSSGTWRVDDVTISGNLLIPPAAPVSYNFFSDASGTQIPGAQGVASYDPVVTTAGTYNYWIAVTDGMCTSDTVMTTITILPTPNLSGMNDTICAGDSVLLSDLITGAMNNTRYSTSFGTYPDTITVKVAPTSDQTYFIIDSVESTGCFDTTRVTIFVNPTPVISGMDISICEGDSILLSDLVSGNMNNTRYGTMFGIYTDTVTTKVAPPTDITYFVIDSVEATGCFDTTAIAVTVFDAAEISGSDISICLGDSVLLSDYITGTTLGIVEYGTAFGNYPYTITTKVAPTTTTSYFIRDSVSSTGCVDTAIVIVEVMGPVLLDLSPIQNICPSQEVDLSAIPLVEINGNMGAIDTTYYTDSLDAVNEINAVSNLVTSTGTYFIRYEVDGCFDITSVNVLITKCCTIEAAILDTICYNSGVYDLLVSITYTDPCGPAFAISLDGSFVDTMDYPPSGSQFILPSGMLGIAFGPIELVFVDTASLNAQSTIPSPFISEIHYDNTGTDQMEGVEISGAAGLDLTGYTLEFYNGFDGAVYSTLNLSGSISSTDPNCGSVLFPEAGIQNGPDGIALIDPDGNVIEFISYEGVFVANDGTAIGMNSTDIGVSETTTTPVSESLQLTDGGWTGPSANSYDNYNPGLTCDIVVPLPLCADTIIYNQPFCSTDCAIGLTFAETVCLDDATFQLKFEIDTFNTLSDSFIVSLGEMVLDTLRYPPNDGDTICIDIPLQGSGMTGLELTVTDAASTLENRGIFISEFHYDDEGTDANEGVEITAPAGTDLSGYQIVFYNGSDGSHYKTTNLSGVIGSTGTCDALFFPISNIQNGPDGLALIAPDNAILEFISYEGIFEATTGLAMGMTSEDIGVFEDGGTLDTESLQKTDGGWTGPIPNTVNVLNTGLSCITPTIFNVCETTLIFDAPDCPLFDLELNKTLTPGQNIMFMPGDLVSFDIVVSNTGDATAYDIDISDAIPSGMIYDPFLNAPFWMADSTFVAIADLAPGEDTTITLLLTLNADFTGTSITNTAEVIFAALASGGPAAPDEDDALNNGSGDDFSSIMVGVCHPTAIAPPTADDVVICDVALDDRTIAPISADPTVLTEDFETDGLGTRYFTSVDEFTDGAGDYFTRTDGTNTDVDGSDLTNIQGSYWFGAQDVDAEGGPNQVTITFAPQDIQGLCNLELSLLLAEDDASDGNEDWDGSASDDNFVHIDYSIDGGAFINGLHIESSNTSTNTEPRVDTDFDGVGDGTVITNNFEAFNIPILNSGNSFTLRITINLEDGDEDIAFDNISITGTTPLYNVYDADPASGGNLIVSGVSEYTPPVIPKGSSATYWFTTLCTTCESEATPVTLYAHPAFGDLACPGYLNLVVGEDCSIENLPVTTFYTSNIESQFITLAIKTYDGTILDPGNLRNYIGEDIIYEVTDTCTGTSCWGNLKLESKAIPKPLILSDTICCTAEIPEGLLHSVSEIESLINSKCTAPLDHISVFKVTEGSLCDTVSQTIQYTGHFRIDEEKQEALVYEHTVLTVPLDVDSLRAPGSVNIADSLAYVDTIVIHDCGDFDFSPESIATYWANQLDPGDKLKNGINEGIPFAYPYIVKDSSSITTRTVTADVVEVKQDTVIEIDGLWVNVQVVEKDTIYDTTYNTVIYPNYLPIDTPKTCNFSIKFVDSYHPDCFENSKLIRTWNVLDWCKGEVKEFMQYVVIKDEVAPEFNVITTTIEVMGQDSLLIGGELVDPDSIDVMVDIDLDKIFQIVDIVDPFVCTASFEIPIFDRLTDNCTDLSDITYTYRLNGEPIETEPGTRFIHDVPSGSSILEITAYDLCGNSTVHEMTLFARDQAAPHVFCKDEIHVTLIDDYGELDGGRVLVPIELFDQGSYDQCGDIILVLAQRLDNKFFCNGEFITAISTDALEFCCEDIGQAIPISLTYFDAFGNTSKCWSTVVIDDKFRPRMTVRDTIIDCHWSFDVEDLPYPHVEAICEEPVLSYINDRSNYDSLCGRGYINRIWTMEGYEQYPVVQRITISDETHYQFNPYQIKWPKHYTGERIEEFLIYELENGECTIWPSSNIDEKCYENDAVTCTDGMFAEAQYPYPKCGLIAQSYEDVNIGPSDTICGKIIRTWTIIDWCTYQPNAILNTEATFEFIKDRCMDEEYYRYKEVEENGYYTYEQIIKVVDTIAPVIENCNYNFAYANDDCVGTIVLSNTATDDGACPSAQFSWELHIENNEGVELANYALQNEEGQIEIETVLLYTGDYKAIWTVEDQCGNTSTCEQDFSIIDTIPPQPYCITDLSTALMSNDGTVTIWASDYASTGSAYGDSTGYSSTSSESATTDNCGIEGVYFRTDSGTLVSNLQLTCIDLNTLSDHSSTGSEGATWIGELVAVDASGNESSCNITLRLQDNTGICGPQKTANVIGQVHTYYGDKIEEVLVETAEHEFMTNESGYYTFKELPMYREYRIHASKDDHMLNGVSAIDLVRIQRHMLALTEFDTPINMIAADINNDGRVSVLDLAAVRSVLLGIQHEFPNNTSWKFIDAKYADMPLYEFKEIPEEIILSNLDRDMDQQDFIGIKIGDVSGNAKANSTMAEARTTHSKTLFIEDMEIKQGATIKVPLRLENTTDLSALQFTMSTPGLVLKAIHSEGIELDESNYAKHNDQISFVWYGVTPTPLTEVNGNYLFTMEFESQVQGRLSDQLDINSNITTAKGYNGADEPFALYLAFTTPHPEYALFQNQPNPFSEETTIQFYMGAEGAVRITIADLTGRVHREMTGDYEQGTHELALHREDLGASGVYVVRMEVSGLVLYGKMVVVD